jgi:fibronectin type 3 domain-containing protein
MTVFNRFQLCFFLGLALLFSQSLAPTLRAQVNTVGQWQTLSTQTPINPVHIALMHNGKVLIVSGSGNLPSDTSYMAAVFDPATGTISTQPVAWDMFCNGMIVLPDGRPFVMGGTLQYDPFFGETHTSIFDPATGQFVDVQTMAHGRWYPTGTVLGDGRVMIFSGLDETGATNTSVEFYSVGSGWSTPFAAPWTPPLYPRMHLLPSGKVFYSGSTTQSWTFNPSTTTWTAGPSTIYSGTRTYGSSVLLPLMPATSYKSVVMIFGGGSPATNTTEMIDLSAASPKWVSGPAMSQKRIEMNATLLPNGKVVATGGSVNDEDLNTISLNADLFTPNLSTVTATMSSGGQNAFARLYHSNALLLPDATVLLIGGNPARGTYEPHLEIYSPPYLFNSSGTLATRPTITGVPSSPIGYGAAFQVQTPDAANISSAVLMRPGAPTHAFDMEQRMVGLTFTAGSGVLNVTAPPNANIAPPGYYMLFLLNAAGVPSLASFVQLSSTPGDQAPTATITSPTSNVTILEGQSVSFAGSGSDPDGTITSYAWSFPGGSPSSSFAASPGNVTYSTPGTYTAFLTVTDNADLTNATPATRTITVQPSFSVSTTPTSQTVAPGGATPFTVTLTPGSGFSGSVAFSVSGLPANTTASFNPASLSTSGSSTMTVSTAASTPGGSYPLTISGTSVGAQQTTSVTLVVNAGGAGAIQFIQSNYATPQTSPTQVPVKFLAAQTAGNLNIVVVGWNDSTSSVISVTDTAGNSYSPAVGPTRVSGSLSQSIYYAKKIAGAAAGANTVTVNFNPGAFVPDVRILEYSGLDQTNPLDVTAAGTGSSATADSGAGTTLNANDLLFGANTVFTGNKSAGAGYTSRIITVPDSDLAEDEVVSATGSYHATASLTNTGAWVMQLAAFKAAGATPTPTAPTNLTATPAGPAQINLSWTASTETGGAISQYLVERCQSAACNTFVQVGTSTSTSYSDTGLAGSTSYSYRVRAQDTFTNFSPYSNTATAVTPAPVITAPSNLIASASGNTQINLTWAVSTETGGTLTTYFIERCQGAGCSNFVQVGTTPDETPSFSDTGLFGSTSYSYRVRAGDALNNLGPYSNVSSATTAAPTLTAPSNLTAAAVSNSQVNLSWTGSTETGGTISQYLIERCLGASCSNFAQVGTSTTTFYSDTGLTASTNYSYRVRATDASNNLSAYSNTASATTPVNSPTAPGSLAASATGPAQINLSWTASTETGGTISQYLVERCQGAGCSSFAQIGTSTTTSYGDTGLTGSTSYSYRVRASDSLNNLGPYSATTSATTPAPTLTAPTSLTASPSGPVQINLSWTASTETGGTLSQYLIERCQGSGCTTFVQVGTSTTTLFSNTGLTGSTSYTYRVRATDALNNLSPYSTSATAVTAAPTLTAPSNLTATPASNTQINLAWTASTETGGTLSNYPVERCQGSGCSNFAQIATPAGTSYSDTALLAATSYSYRVRATDALNNLSPYSNTASATTLSSPPPPPVITFIQVNSATPQSSTAQVNVTYTKAQQVGDLNIVVVGWNDSTAAVTSVTDTLLNTYTLAVGPTAVTGTLSQSIYYAKNIAAAAAGANTVAVKFSPSAFVPDVRILEYSGLDQTNPLDVTAAGSGNSNSSVSLPVPTTYANDLLFGANIVYTLTTGSGSGFAARIITSPDGDIAEDKAVTSTGSYSATAPLSSAGPWIMQMVAFKAHP